MQTVTILGLVNKWDSLSHVQDWVSKNAKSYFGTAKYRKAEGCVRDELVTLGSVVLDAIRGTVMDYGSNTPPTRAVTLIHNNGVITATCDCGGRSSVSACHHIAAFLLYITKADENNVTAPFVCGEPNKNFSYSGYLAAVKTRAELIKLCAEYVPKDVQRKEELTLCVQPKDKVQDAAKGKVQDAVVTTALIEIENAFSSFSGGVGESPKDLSGSWSHFSKVIQVML